MNNFSDFIYVLRVFLLKKVHLELLYCPLGTESVFLNPFNADFRLTALEKAMKYGNGVYSGDVAKVALQKKKDVLFVPVISAEGLLVADVMGKSDPFVVVTMKMSEQKHKTRGHIGANLQTSSP